MKMNETGIPSFWTLGPIRRGLVDQRMTIGWKWHSPMGMYGEAVLVPGMFSAEDLEELIAKMLRFGKKWHRRAVVAPNRHLWCLVWRQREKIESGQHELLDMQADRDAYWIDTRRHSGLLWRALLRIFFGYRRPPALSPEEESEC